MVIPRFQEKTAGATLSACSCLPSSSRAREEEKLTSYCDFVIHLLVAYATNNILANTDMDIMIPSSTPDNAQSNTCSQSGQRPYASGRHTTKIASRNHFMKDGKSQSGDGSKATGVRTSLHRYKSSSIMQFALSAHSQATQHWNLDSQDQNGQMHAAQMPATL